jgi:hypothetical protein
MGTYGGRLVQEIRLNYATTNVATGAFTQVLTACRTDIKSVEIFDSGGGEMILAYGPASSEKTAMRVFPGGTSGPTTLLLNSGMRLALKCADSSTPATVSAGVFIMNLFV